MWFPRNKLYNMRALQAGCIPIRQQVNRAPNVVSTLGFTDQMTLIHIVLGFRTATGTVSLRYQCFSLMSVDNIYKYLCGLKATTPQKVTCHLCPCDQAFHHLGILFH